MASNLVPALDPAPVPGPFWLFHLLWVVTFFLHMVFINMTLGGSLLASFVGSRRRDVQAFFVNVNSWAISFAITFGIAPLLFVQVLYGRLFYTATILVAWSWLGMLGLLAVGYYLNYVAKFRLRKGPTAGIALPISAFCLTLISVIQVVVNLLHLQPNRWEGVWMQAQSAFADPTFLLRWLHFVLASCGMAAVVLAYWQVRKAKVTVANPDQAAAASFGVKAALYTAIGEVIVGFWLLLALPSEVLSSHAGRSQDHAALGVGDLGGNRSFGSAGRHSRSFG